MNNPYTRSTISLVGNIYDMASSETLEIINFHIQIKEELSLIERKFAFAELLSLRDPRHVVRHQFSVNVPLTRRTAQTLQGQIGFISLKCAKCKVIFISLCYFHLPIGIS